MVNPIASVDTFTAHAANTLNMSNKGTSWWSEPENLSQGQKQATWWKQDFIIALWPQQKQTWNYTDGDYTYRVQLDVGKNVIADEFVNYASWHGTITHTPSGRAGTIYTSPLHGVSLRAIRTKNVDLDVSERFTHQFLTHHYLEPLRACHAIAYRIAHMLETFANASFVPARWGKGEYYADMISLKNHVHTLIQLSELDAQEVRLIYPLLHWWPQETTTGELTNIVTAVKNALTG